MASKILPFTGSPPTSGPDDDLREVIERVHDRILGQMGILAALADKAGGDDMVDHALHESAHALDEIAGELYVAINGEETPSIGGAA